MLCTFECGRKRQTAREEKNGGESAITMLQVLVTDICGMKLLNMFFEKIFFYMS